jgi:hypothetical protein
MWRLRWLRSPSAAPVACDPISMNQYPECSPTLSRGVDGGGELRASIDDARWRYDKVMEAVTGADLKASIVATVQAAALAALLTSATSSKVTTPNRVLFVAGMERSWPVWGPPARRSFLAMDYAGPRRRQMPSTSLIFNSGSRRS